MNGTDRRLLAAQKREDDKKWSRRREDALQEQLDAIKKASTGCAWDIGMAFKGAVPANVLALHNAIWPEGMPADAKAEAVGNRPVLESQKAVIARLRAERDAAVEALRSYSAACNWEVIDDGSICRAWLEPDSSTPHAYNGWELAVAALASIKQEAAS